MIISYLLLIVSKKVKEYYRRGFKKINPIAHHPLKIPVKSALFPRTYSICWSSKSFYISLINIIKSKIYVCIGAHHVFDLAIGLNDNQGNPIGKKSMYLLNKLNRMESEWK